MAFFIPSSIQKRLLRYVLARLELFDTDKLDLESLEIGWGRRSTIELRDVALRKEKLSSLIRLPDAIQLAAARVSLLKLTVPADLHTSPIEVEVNGIFIKAKILEDAALQAPEKAGPPSPRLSKARASAQWPATPAEDTVPSTQTLAKSFLAEEPEEEKEQLEAAFNSQSTDLRHSVASSEGGDDFQSGAGLGMGFGLPTFIAAFIKGIGDRLQLVVQDITLDLELDPETPSEHGRAISQTSSATPTTIRLQIEEFDTRLLESPNVPSQAELDLATRQHESLALLSGRQSRRQVRLGSIRGCLVSESSVFAQLSKVFDDSSNAVSPSVTRSKTSQSDFLDDGLAYGEDNDSDALGLGLSISQPEFETNPDTIAEHGDLEPASPLRSSLLDSQDIEGLEDPFFSQQLSKVDAARAFDYDSEASELFHDYPESPASSSSSLNHRSGYSRHMHDSLRQFRKEKRSTSPPLSRRPSTAQSREGTAQPAGAKSTDDSPPIRVPGGFHSDAASLRGASSSPLQRRNEERVLSSSSPRNAAPMKPEDSMLESTMFSHEDAESLYMSALGGSKADEDDKQRIPGTWSEYSSSTNNNSPKAASIRAKSIHSRSTSKVTDQSSIQDPLASSDTQSDVQPSESSHSSKSLGAVDATTTSPRTSRGLDSPKPPPESVREIFRVSSAKIILPGLYQAESDTQDSVDEFSYAQPASPRRKPYVPGAFSMYAESTASLGGQSGRVNYSSTKKPLESKQNKKAQKPPEPNKYEVAIGNVCLNLDVAIGRVGMQIHRRLQTILGLNKTLDEDSRAAKAPAETSEKPSFALNVAVEKIEVAIFEQIMETLGSIRTPKIPEDAPLQSSSGLDTPLFHLNLGKVQLSASQTLESLKGKLEVAKLAFGYHDEQIIYFDEESRLRTSVRDLREGLKKDVTIAFSKTLETTEISIATLPIESIFDIQKLDRTLGSIGGLSGLLELGSSIVSDTTIDARQSPIASKPKSVRFEAKAIEPVEEALPPPLRVNARISGSTLLVKGDSCSVLWQSSAIKLVSRKSAVGFALDDIRISGPFLKQDEDGDPPLAIKVRDLKARFLFAPEEGDLTKLLSLLTPSKDKFEKDDDLLVDTLIRQRRHGSVLRIAASKLEVNVEDYDALTHIEALSAEMSKMSSVTKYLPEESRPGLMVLAALDETALTMHNAGRLGTLRVDAYSLEAAQIALPSLLATSVGRFSVKYNDGVVLCSEVLPTQQDARSLPMLMARIIGDELEPTIKLKLYNTCLEYSVALATDLMGLSEEPTQEELAEGITASIAALTDRSPPRLSKQSSSASDGLGSSKKATKIDLVFRDCALGLSPSKMPSKALFVLTDARVVGPLPPHSGLDLKIEIRKATILLIEDTTNLQVQQAFDDTRDQVNKKSNDQISRLCNRGFVYICFISAALVQVKSTPLPENGSETLDIELKNDLFLLETCADSTQTLIETLGALSPPSPPSQGQKYRTEVAPVEDMMASFTGDAFAVGRNAQEEYDAVDEENLGSDIDPGLMTDFDSADTDTSDDDVYFQIRNENSEEPSASDAGGTGFGFPLQLGAMQPQSEGVSGALKPQAMPPPVDGTANKWDSANNKYIPVSKLELQKSPIKVRIRDTHFLWNLYDGYDWAGTRETISHAVQEVEARANERKNRRYSSDNEQEDESVIGDFLFNSIYIGVGAKQDPKELARQINRDIDDLVSESATQTSSAGTSRPSVSHRPSRSGGRKLKLERSKRHKLAIELRGVSLDFFMLEPGGETQSSIDFRVKDLEIFDQVPTSTWKKFVTYMHDAGLREERRPMVHLEVCDVRPVPELTASELVIRVTVLPLRLHVDQDALDFMTRFFEFNDKPKDAKAAGPEQPYLQRVEVRPVPICLDYKPKKVDYAGLRSGRTTEFMNFFNLDGASLVLKHAIVYGCSGFTKLHKSLEDVWMPDVRRNQLPSVLSGLNGVRTLVNVGSGVRDLVVIPVREYRKDGRIVRSISRGALAFARSTGSELTRFGARLAIGAQNYLQGAEDFLAPSGRDDDWEAADEDDDERRAISRYANQPAGILQGLKGAARSLERDLLVAKDTIIAISGELRDEGSLEGAARVVARNAPTLVLRPMIGASKAVSQTLMGATNSVDPLNRRRISDKYKQY